MWFSSVAEWVRTWRNRWDSFCLVSPNWTVQLPDGQYAGCGTGGFMPRNEFVAYLERYAAESGAPIARARCRQFAAVPAG